MLSSVYSKTLAILNRVKRNISPEQVPVIGFRQSEKRIDQESCGFFKNASKSIRGFSPDQTWKLSKSARHGLFDRKDAAPVWQDKIPPGRTESYSEGQGAIAPCEQGRGEPGKWHRDLRLGGGEPVEAHGARFLHQRVLGSSISDQDFLDQQ